MECRESALNKNVARMSDFCSGNSGWQLVVASDNWHVCLNGTLVRPQKSKVKADGAT